MKISLVVAQGVHAGKIIPILAEQFLIGRDPHCNLRPASPSISKQHCGIFLRGNQVFVRDYGSTNGTSVNGEQIADEIEVFQGDLLKVGPLEFTIQFDVVAERETVQMAAQLAAVGSVSSDASSGAFVGSAAFHAEESENAAALLLAMDDSGSGETTEAQIPDGTTVMDVPAVPGATPAKAVPGLIGDTSKAASDILSKYMRRPRT